VPCEAKELAEMTTRRERRAWRAEFKSLGTRQVSDRERAAIWHEDKAQEARRWLRAQERRVPVALAVIGWIVVFAIAAITYFKK